MISPYDDPIHVYPTNDIFAHEMSVKCKCGPLEDPEAPGVYVHNSLKDMAKLIAAPQGGTQ